MKFLTLDTQGVLRESTLPSESDSFAINLEWYQELRPLKQDEIDQGFISLPDCPIENSVYFSVSNATQLEGIDFEIQRIGEVCRLVFINELIPGGLSELAAGDLVLIKFAIENATEPVLFQKETFVLSATDISNQYVSVAGIFIGQFEKVMSSGITFSEKLDYTLESAANVTRVVFAQDLSLSGVSPLSEGDIVQILYAVTSF